MRVVGTGWHVEKKFLVLPYSGFGFLSKVPKSARVVRTWHRFEWALYLLMESRFVVHLVFNTPRALRELTLKVFLHTPTINLINLTVNKVLP